MSVDTDAAADHTSDDVEALAAALGEAITEMPVYERFEEAKAAVEADPEAQQRIQTFESVREEYMLARQTGNADQEDLAELKEAKANLHDLPVMEEYTRAKSDLEVRLQDLNDLVSDELAVDFGQTAGGCCEDD